MVENYNPVSIWRARQRSLCGPFKNTFAMFLIRPPSNLRELENNGLVSRHGFSTAQPHVEYQLTPNGQSLFPILNTICDWGNMHINYELIARSLCDE